MQKAYIALFFEDTVCLIKERLMRTGDNWKFPGGELNPNETPLEGGFRNFAIKTGKMPSSPEMAMGYRKIKQRWGDEDDINLEDWARRTNHRFEIAQTTHSNPLKPVEKTYFYL